jgi:hypothetical protein
MSNAEAGVPAPDGLIDLAVNRLLHVGLDLNQALTLVGGRHDTAAGRRIRTAMGRIDDTIDELRHAVMAGAGPR